MVKTAFTAVLNITMRICEPFDKFRFRRLWGFPTRFMNAVDISLFIRLRFFLRVMRIIVPNSGIIGIGLRVICALPSAILCTTGL